MAQPNPAALDFLLTRRSRPAKLLQAPWPDRAALEPILTAGLRSPDHGKLEPWRLLVLNDAALNRLAETAARRGAEMGLPQEQIDKVVAQYRDSGCAVVVVSRPVASDKVPAIEQVLSAGAVCLGILNAALASGWGASWLTGWAVHDRAFRESALGLGDRESVAGVIHIGTARATPPERPRPDPAKVITWVEA